MVGGSIRGTGGFFSAHSVASGAVGPLAGATRGHDSSLYLLFYYMGSSITGSAGGGLWLHGGWPGIVWLTAALALAGLAQNLGGVLILSSLAILVLTRTLQAARCHAASD